MLVVRYDGILEQIYSLYTEDSKDILENISFVFSGEFDENWFDRYDKIVLSEHLKKLIYLRGHYKYSKRGSVFIFEKGCLKSFDPETNTLYFRNKSEWFRKLPTDILFIQREFKVTELNIRIPKLWIRSQELPIFKIWADQNGYRLLDSHIKRIETMLEKFTLEKVIRNTHSITRRYFLRYYFLIGAITYDQYMRHRRKTSKEMKADPRLMELE